MKKRFSKSLFSLLALMLGLSFTAACGGTGNNSDSVADSSSHVEESSSSPKEDSSSGGGSSEEPDKPKYEYGNYAALEKTESFEGLVSSEKWATTVEKYTVIENGFLTLHPGTTQATLKDLNFENGSFEFQVKPNMKGDAVCFVLCLQNDKYDDMNYSSGMKNYTISVDNKGGIELIKYMGEDSESENHMKKLAKAEEGSETLASGAAFVDCKIDLKSGEDGTQITFSVGKMIAGKLKYTQYIDYTDVDSPYCGGRFAFATMNGSGLAVADGKTDNSEYVQPELPPFEAIKVEGTPTYTGEETLSLFTGMDSPETTLAAFADGWSGRNGVFNYEASEKTYEEKYGIRLLPALNAEEGGTTEFVGHYNKYLFDQVQFDLTFSIDKLDNGWLMFWFKLLSETQNVSAWGNKFTREASQCYMTYLNARGDLYFNKWTDWQQFFLGDTKNVRRLIDPQEVNVVKHVRFYVEYAKLNPETEAEYDSVITSMYFVEEGREILLKQYQDSKDVLLNPGFFGLQTFEGAIMTIYEITATPLT